VGSQTILQSERWIDLFAVSAKTTILLHPCHYFKDKFEASSMGGGGVGRRRRCKAKQSVKMLTWTRR